MLLLENAAVFSGRRTLRVVVPSNSRFSGVGME